MFKITKVWVFLFKWVILCVNMIKIDDFSKLLKKSHLNKLPKYGTLNLMNKISSRARFARISKPYLPLHSQFPSSENRIILWIHRNLTMSVYDWNSNSARNFSIDNADITLLFGMKNASNVIISTSLLEIYYIF